MPRNNKIPMVIYFSESHEVFFKKYFKPSFDAHLADEFRLVVTSGAQVSSEGHYRDQGWAKQVAGKIKSILDYLCANTDEEYVVYSDVDIVYFAPCLDAMLKELGDGDMAFQNDSGKFCTGLFILRNTPKVRELLKVTYDDCFDCDQGAFNRVVGRSSVDCRFLSEKFYSIWRATNSKTWHHDAIVRSPRHDVLAFHANYTVGHANKLALLDLFIAMRGADASTKMKILARQYAKIPIGWGEAQAGRVVRGLRRAGSLVPLRAHR